MPCSFGRTGLVLFAAFSFLVYVCTGCTPTTEDTGKPPMGKEVHGTQVMQGSVPAGGTYRIEYFENASPAQDQIKNGDIPNVVKVSGGLLVLDANAWPTGWAVGKIVAVRMPDQTVEYKRLLIRFLLDDGHLAIGVTDASLLEVVDNAQIDVDSASAQSSQQVRGGVVKAVSKAVRTAGNQVTVIDTDFSKTVTLFEMQDQEIYNYSTDNVEVTLSCSEVSLKATPHLRIKLVIDRKQDLWSKILDTTEGALAKIGQDISDFVDSSGEVIEHDFGGAIVLASAGAAQNLVDEALGLTSVADNLKTVTDALSDVKRITDATAEIEGDITGTVTYSAQASGEYSDERETIPLATILIPVAGPVPLFVQFDVVGVAGMDFHGTVHIGEGAQLAIPFYAGMKISNGVFVDVPKPDTEPTLTLFPPSFDGTEAGMELSAGIRCKAGLTLAKILSVTVNPEADLVLQGDAQVTGDVLSGCVDLDWGLYGRLTADLSAELSIPGVYDKEYTPPWGQLSYEFPLATPAPWSQCWGAEGTISGAVKDAVTSDPLDDVTVTVLSGGSTTGQATTDANGTYTLDVASGTGYTITVAKTGYITETYQDIEVTENNVVHLETILQISNSYSGTGSISGTIVSALDGSGVNGLAVNLRRGINAKAGAIQANTTTSNSGQYIVSQLDAGAYTAEASGSGYATSYFTVICIGGTTNPDQNGTITPVLPAGETRIVLTWGETPWDLDSHLTGPLPDGSRFHMYYPYADSNDGSPWPDIITLDLDDTSSYGPETTTIHQQMDGVYRFSVYDFSNRGSTDSTELSNSGAQVRIYRGNSGLTATFNVPVNAGGILWTVFELNGDNLTPINSMSYVSDSGAVQAPRPGTNGAGTDGPLMRDMPPKE